MLKFAEELRKLVNEAMPGMNVKIESITKNNGVERIALQIFQKENAVAPNIYIEDFYEQYRNGRDIKQIVMEIVDAYKFAMRKSKAPSVNLNFEEMKDKIFFTVVNVEKNKNLLPDIPHILWNDLAIIFRCIVERTDEGLSSFIIRKALADVWDLSPFQLMDIAKENTPKLFPWSVASMKDMMLNFNKKPEPYDLDCVDFDTELPLYVATNSEGVNGAQVLLYSDMLAAFAEKCNSDFFIFPSSIHEIILFPAESNSDIVEYQNMVREVNATQVSPEEFLSDNVYYYDRALGKVEVA